MPGSFPRAIHKGFKTCPVQKAAARKEETLGSMSVKSASCECRKGELTNCYRVRQDFTKMTIEQRKRFINTYKLASVHPLFKRDYEKTVTLHLDAKDQAKLPHLFLPWHRWFLVEFENLLRRIDCRVTIPYWNWSKKTHHWWRGSGNKDLWNSGDHGLRGDGSVHGEN